MPSRPPSVERKAARRARASAAEGVRRLEIDCRIGAGAQETQLRRYVSYSEWGPLSFAWSTSVKEHPDLDGGPKQATMKYETGSVCASAIPSGPFARAARAASG